MLFWKNGAGDRNIYDLFAANLNVVDENFLNMSTVSSGDKPR